MSSTVFRACLAGVSLFAFSTSAHAQALSAQDAAALRAEIAALKERMAAMEAKLNAASPAPNGSTAAPVASAAATPAPAPAATGQAPIDVSWRNAPQIKQGDWSFKPKGRIQFDAGSVMAPGDITDRGLGFSSEARRIRLGGEGTMPGGFGYKLEVELSDNAVDLVDTFISWRKGGLEVRLGNQNQFQSFDELIGDTSGSVMERAAFTDAWNFERRLGLAVEWQKGPLMLQGGVFTDSIDSLSNSSDGVNGGDENNSYSIDGRVVFAPKLGDVQLHFAASGHVRELNRLSDGTVRYRQRPFVHSSNSRFLDTGAISATGETHYGLEFAAVAGPWTAAAETHWLSVDRIDAADPTFFGGYAEIGYFLTKGDSRVYKKGIFDRTPPAHGMDKGGIGSIQLTIRYDYLNMNDADIRGGTQNGYIAGITWSPVQFLRLNANYAHLDYTGAAILSNGSGDYGINVIGLRAEFDY